MTRVQQAIETNPSPAPVNAGIQRLARRVGLGLDCVEVRDTTARVLSRRTVRG